MTTSGYVSWDVFVPEILQYVNGAPSILVRIHIRNTIINFCERTLILQRDPSNFSMEEDVAEYKLKFSSDRYRALACDEVRIGEDNSSLPLLRTTMKELDSEFSNWRKQTALKPTRYFLMEDINKIKFFPMPSADVDDDTIIRTRVAPKRDQVEFDDFLYEKWHEVIQNGAISTLLAVKGGSWVDVRLATAFGMEYKRGVNNARKVALTGTGNYPGRVIPQSFDVMGQDYRRSGSWV